MRVFQFGAGTHGQGCGHRPDVGPELLHQLLRQPRAYELRKQFLVGDVGVYDILQAVLKDEPVKIVRGHHYCPRDRDPHTAVFGHHAVFLQNAVHESQSPGLAAQRALSHPGKTDIVRIGVLVERCDDSLPRLYTVVLDLPYDELPDILRAAEVGKAGLAYPAAQTEQAAGIHPLRQPVLGCIVLQLPVRNLRYQGLQFLEVLGPGYHQMSIQILDHEISETELLAYIFGKLDEQGAGIFLYKAGSYLPGNLSHTALRRLQDDGHLRNVLPDVAAQIYTGIYLLHLRPVPLVHDETHIGYHS